MGPRSRPWRMPARVGGAGASAAAALFGLTTLAIGAGAATVKTDFPCYLQNRAVRLSGTGFAPRAPYAVTVDGHPLGSGHANDDGTISGSLDSGPLFGGASHQRHRLSASDAMNAATADFDVTRFSADFAPAAGNPRTLHVRYSVFGFALADPHRVTVYLHYLSPRGGVRRTVALGQTHGTCGSLPLTRRHRLFPFRPSTGRWRLQFDTSAHYSPSNRPHVVRTLAVGAR